MDLIPKRSDQCSFEHIFYIVVEIGIATPMFVGADAVGRYVPRVLVMEIMAYRGIDMLDIKGIRDATLRGVNGYIQYILTHDLPDHIERAFSCARWFDIAAEHKYDLTHATAAAIAPRAALNMLLRFVWFGTIFSLHNAYPLLAVVDMAAFFDILCDDRRESGADAFEMLTELGEHSRIRCGATPPGWNTGIDIYNNLCHELDMAMFEPDEMDE